MVWYMLALILASISMVCGICAAFRFRSDKLDDFIDWIQPRVKKILIIWFILNLTVTMVLIKPLSNTVRCQFDGNVHNTETTYSWYRDGTYEEKCLFVSKNGSYMPLKIMRDQPDGDQHLNINN